MKNSVVLHLTENHSVKFVSQNGKYYVIAIVTKFIGSEKITMTVMGTNVPNLQNKEIIFDDEKDTYVARVDDDIITFCFK